MNSESCWIQQKKEIGSYFLDRNQEFISLAILLYPEEKIIERGLKINTLKRKQPGW